MSAVGISTYVLSGFDDPRCSAAAWNSLLPRGETNAVFLTAEYQRAWWESFDRNGLLLIAAECEGEILAIAPFFAEESVVYFVGSGGSDYLDFVGDISVPGVLKALLETAYKQIPALTGFVFYHLPSHSRTCGLIEQLAPEMGVQIAVHEGLPAPFIDIAGNPEAARAATEKRSLVQSERTLRRDGALEIEHLREGRAIVAHLPEFMQQHIERWAVTPSPSQFHRAAERKFFERLSHAAAGAGWLRFTRIVWNGALVACHLGFCHSGSYYFYKPTYSLQFAKRSPGQVLLRNVLLAALEEGAHTFDLGLGDEEFKKRFATGSRQVINCALGLPGKPLTGFW